MKYLYTFIVFLIIVGLGLLIGWVTFNGGDNSNGNTNLWGILFIPWLVAFFYWLFVIRTTLMDEPWKD